MSEKLINAAQAVIERWDSPQWNWGEPTAALIHDLRQAVDSARHQGQDEAKAASVELIRDGDAVCTTCRWKGAHSPDCPLKDEPRPMIEVQAHQDPRERIAELEDVIEFTLESVYSVEHPKLPQAGCLGLGITSDAYCKLEAALQAKGAVS